MRKIYFILAIILFIISVITLLFISLTKNNIISIKDLHWGSKTSMIAINNIKRNNSPGLLLVRIVDGKEQFFPGNFNAHMQPSSILIYGKDQNNESKIYFINEQDSISNFSLPEDFPEIQDAQTNENGSYISIKISEKGNSLFCFSELSEDKISKCKKMAITGDAQVLWDHNDTQLAFVKSARGSYKKIDMWNNADITDYSDNENEEYKKIADKFISYQSLPLSSFSFGFLKIFNMDGKYSLHNLPGTISNFTLFDNDHIVQKNNTGVYIYEISTRNQATVIEDSHALDYQILFYSHKQTASL